MISHGDIVWVDFGNPRGSEPAKRRPAVVLQEDWLLRSTIATVLVVPLTSNTGLQPFPGNVLIPARTSGLDKDSVALVTQLGPVSREYVDPHPAGEVTRGLMQQIARGVRLVTGI